MADPVEEARVRKIVEKYKNTPFKSIVEKVPLEDTYFRNVKNSHIEIYVRKAIANISENDKRFNSQSEQQNRIKKEKLDTLARRVKTYESNLSMFHGYEDEKKKISKYVLENFHLKKRLNSLKVRSSFHIIIDGMSGVGKTFLVQTIAGEFKLPVLHIELLANEINRIKTKLEDIVEFLKDSKPMILLLDDVDFNLMSNDNDSSDSSNKLSYVLASFIDDISDKTNSLIIATASSLTDVNHLLTRNGRIERNIHLGLPDQTSRLLMLKSKLSRIIDLTDAEYQSLVISTPGFIASDINSLIRHAFSELFDSDQFSSNRESSDQLNVENFTKSQLEFKHLLKAASLTIPSSQKYGHCSIPDVKWSDIGSMEEIKTELRISVLASLYHPDLCKSLNVTMSNGILLEGPPGCGKTLLAKALANEAGVNFISVKGPELLSMWVGESEKAVRNVFQNARNSMPCILFFDEIDSICPLRNSDASGSSNHISRMTNQMLTEMDGLNLRENVFVLAATNRVDMIDKAILRPGRFDKIIKVSKPNQNDRFLILKNHLEKIPVLKDHLVDTLCYDLSSAKYTCGYSGADLAGLVKEASLNILKKILKPDDLTNITSFYNQRLSGSQQINEPEEKDNNFVQLFSDELKKICMNEN